VDCEAVITVPCVGTFISMFYTGGMWVAMWLACELCHIYLTDIWEGLADKISRY